MITLTAQGIANVIGGQLISGPAERVASGGVSVDTRTMVQHAVFFALGGENFDGNTFAQQASQAGASVVVVSRVLAGIDESCAVILVPDALVALQALATWWRGQLVDTCVIGLTGSSGKTSTKDMTQNVLSQAMPAMATKGNLNNHIGLPLSVLATAPSTCAAVWEMGMNHAGELAPLCAIAAPRVGIIVSIGPAHIEYLGSLDAIAEEKATLARALPSVEQGGVLIIPASCDYAEYLRGQTVAKVLTVGIEQGDIQARGIRMTSTGSHFTLSLPDGQEEQIDLPLLGTHTVCNALLAAAAGWVMGVTPQQIKLGLATSVLTRGRLDCFISHGITVIDDTYNANPDSMLAALKTLVQVHATGRRFTVLGSMGELGDHSHQGHSLVGQATVELGCDVVVCVGDAESGAAIIAESAQERAQVHDAKPTIMRCNRDTAVDYLCTNVQVGDVVLFKGSRSAKMEEVMNSFLERKSDKC